MTELESMNVSRRGFLKVCTLAAGAVGLPAWAGEKMAEKAASGAKPSVIWLHFQECTGCTESLLRTSAPDVADAHPRPHLARLPRDAHGGRRPPGGEAALEAAMRGTRASTSCIVEGAIPTKEDGIYCRVGGKTAMEIAAASRRQGRRHHRIGSCASWGGIPSAAPNPTGAVGVNESSPASRS